MSRMPTCSHHLGSLPDGMVCRLRRCLYGPKQTLVPRLSALSQWWLRLVFGECSWSCTFGPPFNSWSNTSSTCRSSLATTLSTLPWWRLVVEHFYMSIITGDDSSTLPLWRLVIVNFLLICHSSSSSSLPPWDLLARAALTWDSYEVNIHLCVHLRSLPVWMGILCLAAGCYVNCLNPTSRVPLLGDTMTARSSTTNGEQELGQSAHTWILPTGHAREHGATYRQGQGRTLGERGMLNQVRDTKSANRTRTPSQTAGNEECTGTWDAGSKSICCHYPHSLLCCLVYQLFSVVASSPWVTCVALISIHQYNNQHAHLLDLNSHNSSNIFYYLVKSTITWLNPTRTL